jgi:glucosamine--fructose-6-phosphate aminotransferase (isomerizing)
LAFSRSGKSFDILSGVRNAKKDGAYVVSITAEKESELSALSDSILLLADKDKDAITAPKTLLSQMVLCYMLAQALSGKPYDNLLSLPDVLNDVVSATLENIKLNAAEIKSLDNYIILSRGLDYIAAAELSLKLSEICHKFSRPFSTGEFIFGPIAMVDETRNIILVAPDSEFTKEYTDIARRLSLLGVNKIIALSDVEEILEISDVKIAAPKTAKEFAPFVYVLISELLSSYIGQHLNIQNSKVRHAKRDEL